MPFPGRRWPCMGSPPSPPSPPAPPSPPSPPFFGGMGVNLVNTGINNGVIVGNGNFSNNRNWGTISGNSYSNFNGPINNGVNYGVIGNGAINTGVNHGMIGNVNGVWHGPGGYMTGGINNSTIGMRHGTDNFDEINGILYKNGVPTNDPVDRAHFREACENFSREMDESMAEMQRNLQESLSFINRPGWPFN